MSLLRPLALALLLGLCAAAQARTESPSADAPGASDHPLLRRFEGSLLVGYAQADWAAASLPGSQGVNPRDKRKFADPLNVEGKVTRLFYLAPQGKSPLEVFRNHQQALNAAGFKPRWSCETGGRGCADPYLALEKYRRMRGMAWSKGSVLDATKPSSSWGLEASITFEEGRLLVGTLSRGGKTLELMLYSSWAAGPQSQRAATYIEIVEPKAMPTGQVMVDAQALGQGLEAEGKVAVHGVFFDTGKTELKPESAAQLDQMAALLKSQAGLKVFIVGHTDNVGSLDANLALSQGRAQAVVTALTQRGIAASRLQARGVASLAPVAANTAEEGRARNRRVELVSQ